MTDPETIGILDVKALLEKLFPGVPVSMPETISGYQAEVSFHEYDLRVILVGNRVRDRQMHVRFLQRVEQPGDRKATKRVITDLTTKDPADVIAAIEDAKAYLLGVVQAINMALRPVPVQQTRSIDDLLRGR